MRKILTIVLVLMVGSGLPGCASTSDSDNTFAAAAEERIVVFGASGKSGRYILRELQEQGRNFVAVTSNIKRARENVSADYQWVQADVRDPAQVQSALQDATQVISALGATQFKGDNSPEFVDFQGVANVVDGAVAVGAQQMVLISASGVTTDNHPLNKLGNVMDWKLKGENYLRASGLPYTIIRPGGLLDRDAGEFLVVFRQGDDLPYTSKLSVTTRGDLALICIAALDIPAARNKTFEVFDDRTTPAEQPDWDAEFAALVADQ
jgi:uncharacterized protein YbjT (DUF2867 family)